MGKIMKLQNRRMLNKVIFNIHKSLLYERYEQTNKELNKTVKELIKKETDYIDLLLKLKSELFTQRLITNLEVDIENYIKKNYSFTSDVTFLDKEVKKIINEYFILQIDNKTKNKQ